MRRTLLAALAAMPFGTGCGIFVASGAARLPYHGHTLHQGRETDIGFALPSLPRWAVALAVADASGDSAPYVVPNCFGATVAPCHPDFYEIAAAFQVEYRWDPAKRVHPLASAALGSVRSEYVYRSAYTSSCQNQYCSAHADSAQSSRFAGLAGGGELNVTGWLHVSLLAGYRQSYANSAAIGTASNSGFTVTSLFTLGKPYRNP